MLYQIASIFDDMSKMMKRLKKKSYEKNMNEFRQKYATYFSEMADYMNTHEEKEVAATELATCFVREVDAKFRHNNKIRSTVQFDLSMFMVYYVFPAILMMECDSASIFADAICVLWQEHFGNKIDYADYETVYNAFQEKIFGIF